MLLFALGVKQKTVVGNSFKGSFNVLKLVVFCTNLLKTSFENQTKGIVRIKERTNSSVACEILAILAKTKWLVQNSAKVPTYFNCLLGPNFE